MGFCTPTICQPGGTPTWTLPAPVNGPPMTVWATYDDLCRGCGDCEFTINPDTYEVLIDGEPTGVSFLDKLGEATMLVAAAAEIRCPHRPLGLCVDTIRPACTCRCAPCVCGVRIDAITLPEDTQQILAVTVDGINVPEFLPAPSPTILTTPDPAVASVVAGPASNELTVTINPGAPYGTVVAFLYDNLDGHGPHEVRVTVSGAQSGATPSQVIGLPGTAHLIRLPARAQWRLDRIGGKVFAVKVDPYADCHHIPGGTCGCQWAGGLSMGSWPRMQRIDLPDIMDCTWSITVLRGCPVPPAGRTAVAELACRLTRECLKLPCDLPDSVARIVRGGVEVTFNDAYKAARTEEEVGFGVKAVSRFLDTLPCPPVPVTYVDPAEWNVGDGYTWPTHAGQGWR